MVSVLVRNVGVGTICWFWYCIGIFERPEVVFIFIEFGTSVCFISRVCWYDFFFNQVTLIFSSQRANIHFRVLHKTWTFRIPTLTDLQYSNPGLPQIDLEGK